MHTGTNRLALIKVIRFFPEAAGSLLENALGVGMLPAEYSVRPIPGDFCTSNYPRLTLKDFWPDRVLLLEAQGRPLLCLAVEIQLHQSADCRDRWPLYCDELRRQQRPGAPVQLMVLTIDHRTARWARQTLSETRKQFSSVPLVVGPDTLPEFSNIELARKNPALAVLSAVMHSQSEQAGRLALASIQSAPLERFPEKVLLMALDVRRRRA